MRNVGYLFSTSMYSLKYETEHEENFQGLVAFDLLGNRKRDVMIYKKNEKQLFPSISCRAPKLKS